MSEDSKLQRKGAEAILRSAVAAGVEVCFANPGTTEMEFVDAFDRVDSMRPVLGLFEGVCTGAADGYTRMARKPALTLLHLGPGFANGIANLHNARRAASPVVNLIGDHATWHVAADAPLTSEIESLARPVGWVRKTTAAEALLGDFGDALRASVAAPGTPASLIVPQDFAAAVCDTDPPPVDLEAATRGRRVADSSVAAAAEALRGEGALLFLGGRALDEGNLRAAARIAAGTGCRLVHETFTARVERGGGLPVVERLPYFPEQARELLDGSARCVLAGVKEPVSFFGYPGMPSRLLPDACERRVLAAPSDDVASALHALADLVGAEAAPPSPTPAHVATGTLDVMTLGTTLAALQPEGAIVVDEAATTGLGYYFLAAGSPRHSLLQLTGGAIGQGLPCAAGAAVACPDRRVIAFQADGSGMYTLQALWTMAREALDVTVVVCANRGYKILDLELMRAGVSEPGPKARSLTDLRRPTLDWVKLAAGHGVEGVRVDTAEAFADAFRSSLATPGPRLIEAVLA